MSLEVKEILKIGEGRLLNAGCMDARRDAEELMCYLLNFDRGRFFMNLGDVLSEKSCEAFFQLVDIRASRKPLQHIVGNQEFMGITFRVNNKVLIPRQDTETMVEAVLDYMKSAKLPVGGWKIMDIGTGSGAIAVSLCAMNVNVKAVASDISRDALDVAKRNAGLAGVSSKIKFVESDMFKAFRSGIGGDRFNIIVSNPPYIQSHLIPTLQREISEHEPVLALDGGADGLDFYRILADQAHKYLKRRGVIFLEIGYDQGESVTELFDAGELYEELTILKDLAGNDRVFTARLKKR